MFGTRSYLLLLPLLGLEFLVDFFLEEEATLPSGLVGVTLLALN